MCCLLARPHFLLSILLISLLLLTTSLVIAQDEPPAPQFLYRNENRLVLINGYTGEATELPFDVSERDRFAWSPDGKYLLTRLSDIETHLYCLNLYDVDIQEWVYNEPLACSVEEAIFSTNSKQLIYTIRDESNEILWIHDFESGTTQELYQTTIGSANYEAGISHFEWSPTTKYLTFNVYRWIMGGTLNGLVVMNIETLGHITLHAPNTYYASYYPIWSTDDSWFLIVLKDEYVTNGVVPHTNHLGDVYLMNSDTGAKYRITYTPTVREVDVRWTEDRSIAFTEVIEQEWIFTIEEAMNVVEVPREEIVTPEPFDTENYFNSSSSDILVSPDSERIAWVVSTEGHDGNRIYELNFGSTYSRTVEFSIPLPESYQFNNIIIGWRPSDYPYPQG
jgi:hypothetical protein